VDVGGVDDGVLAGESRREGVEGGVVDLLDGNGGWKGVLAGRLGEGCNLEGWVCEEGFEDLGANSAGGLSS